MVMCLQSKKFTDYLLRLRLALSSSQKEAYEKIASYKQNCYLTGVAGSGKSYLLKCLHPILISFYGYPGVVLTAVSNVAAININGLTLSKFMGLAVEDLSTLNVRNHVKNQNPKILQAALLCKVLIIDEAGMCERDNFNFLDKYLREVKKLEKPFGGVRIILIGDVLQLEPIKKKDPNDPKKKVFPGFFFQSQSYKEGKFFVCYLRENHRQEGDTEFLIALNKVRVGDDTVVDYMNDIIYPLNVASSTTLEMAKEKVKHESKDLNLSKSILNRTSIYKYLYPTRNNNNYFEKNEFKMRLENSTDTSYSDLIVCLERSESDIYTNIRSKDKTIEICEASETSTQNNYTSNFATYAPKEILDKLSTKLEKTLKIYVGMPCKVSYRTDSKYICANTLVVIKSIIYSGDKKHVEKIEVETTSSKCVRTHFITRVTLTEFSNNVSVSRTQFPLLSSVGLLPWGLQGLTISENIFYDNSKSCGGESAGKGLLYTVMSRVNKKEQISFLHEITADEIRSGVNKNALGFDNKYRLKTEQVVFDLAEEIVLDKKQKTGL